MQKSVDISSHTLITPTAPIKASRHGARAKCLQRLVRLDMPVPRTLALDFDSVRDIAAGQIPDLQAIIDEFAAGALITVRPSSEVLDWGGPSAFLNIGMGPMACERLSAEIGEEAAQTLFAHFIRRFAVNVERLDAEVFENFPRLDSYAVADMLAAYEAETERPFPFNPADQLRAVLQSMARAWDGTSARLLRQAKGAPLDAGLGLVIQEMVLGVGPGSSGEGVIRFVSPISGRAEASGHFVAQCLNREDVQRGRLDPAALDELPPDQRKELSASAERMRIHLKEEMQIEFVVNAGRIAIIDAVRVARQPRAALRIAVDLARDGVIDHRIALCRIDPGGLTELMHRQIDPDADPTVLITGIAASPGAATGRLVFSSREATASAARGEPCVMIRRETTTEDVRGMHAASAVVTERGGITSHAAVIARGIGVPCVVGAAQMRIDRREGTISTDDGETLHAGDIVTVDGSSGRILAGTVPLLEPGLDDAFTEFMEWADEARDIGVRANADTTPEAQMARTFGVDGIGLTRTEHMFVEADRLTLMREMIFADTPEDRRAALDRLLPMQRADFADLFRIMQGRPVCIRLFDPPLHEFLPAGQENVRELAAALGLPASDVNRRVQELSEYNPMLGMRGVRLGITVPEIYDMQAQAIFEATLDAGRDGKPVVPEIMIPLVSAKREVELVKARVDAVAAAVSTERGEELSYRLGVMVETPRAALRADEIASHSAFLSFGTNDLTQMTYGLSRDDAGRFMGTYVSQGVFAEDPFHVLDSEGVGELLRMGAERGRKRQPDLILSLCGEHGGDTESIRFCREIGFNYVSCSPFRVPVAKLAAAQLAIESDDSQK